MLKTVLNCSMVLELDLLLRNAKVKKLVSFGNAYGTVAGYRQL